ncbi:MAG: UDP-N-acetylglucosamine 2-epimerase (non-hydrolyzing) [Candidatus Calescibacterium sp.]|nr:UDP-N-acetylglucosamine 2-epimerase (non-hydrolyzing) [Candidatus Calescibacterium sp.]MCX7972843.1 UDP-N-acetylglucosamine 2-epimerase (non-hydrolyzing) [bacterium]MDW8195235.1 UDP-N-acetylglucosamine 2-epimerase (non-hydrolyzing) [Candidatus Calescibacterium sp.]
MRYCFVVGTRPELIKTAPVIDKFKKNNQDVMVLSTSQHKELLETANRVFNIKFDYDLDIMKPNQNLFDISINVLSKIREFFEYTKPKYIFVQGDTSTAFIVALASFYHQDIYICHIEAGLRSFDKYQPFPEEINRRLISVVADYHFCPTSLSAKNLYRENIRQNVFITGNTVVDALLLIDPLVNKMDIQTLYQIEPNNYILVEVHRRESFGKTMIEILESIDEIQKITKIPVIFPVHYNPNVRKPAFEILSKNKNIRLIDPIDYLTMLSLIKNARIIITDSGGIQEEAPTYKTPVIVVRNKTERPEGIKHKFIILAGTDKKQIIQKTIKHIDHKQKIIKSNVNNPYGDGLASQRIFDIIVKNTYTPFQDNTKISLIQTNDKIHLRNNNR